MTARKFKTVRTTAGFGLIEIMTALLLGIIIMLGVTEIVTNNSATRYELQRTGQQIESATYALQVLENDLVSAGFWGEMGEQTNQLDTLNNAFRSGDACSAPTAAQVAALPPVPICPGAAGDSCDARIELVRSTLFPVDGGTEVGKVSCVAPKADTNFIAIRRASSCALGTPGCGPQGTNFHLQVNSCFNPNDDSYPLPGIDFRIDTNLANLNYQIRQNPCKPIGSAPTDEFAPRYRFLSRVYFVNSQDQLVRSELVGNAYQENVLVEGVELMRLEYGLDPSGDGQVDQFRQFDDPPVGAEWSNVVMVRITLIVRNLESSAGHSDTREYRLAGTDESYLVPVAFQNHRRQVYTRTVSLRNVAGRRG